MSSVHEPDPHDYHRDFEVRPLVEEIARHLHVQRLHTDLRVSYFYEMFHELDEYPPIATLEDSLAGKPGLNVVVVARRTDGRATIEPEVHAQLTQMSQRAPAPVEHLEAIFDFARDATARYPLTIPSGELLQHAGWASLEPLRRAPSVLVYSGQPSVRSGAAALDRWLRTAGSAAPAIEPIGPGTDRVCHRGTHAVCVLFIDAPVTAADLLQLIGCCRDYGMVYIERSGAGQVVEIGDREREALAAIPVLSQTCGARDALRGLISHSADALPPSWRNHSGARAEISPLAATRMP